MDGSTALFHVRPLLWKLDPFPTMELASLKWMMEILKYLYLDPPVGANIHRHCFELLGEIFGSDILEPTAFLLRLHSHTSATGD